MNWRIPTALLVVCAGALYLCSRPLDIVAPDGKVALAQTDYQATFWNHAPEYIVALATVLTLFGILYQAEEMKKATAAMRESTDEVKKQTGILHNQTEAIQNQGDAVINIERAWLVPNGFVIPDELPKYNVSSAQEEQFTVNIKNFGRTPAFLTGWLCKTLVSEDADIADLLSYQTVNNDRNGVPIPQGQDENFFADWKIEGTSEINMIRQGRKQLYVYGFVKYWDIFKLTPHETYFCFHYQEKRDNRGLIKHGWAVEPDMANRHT